MRQNVQQLRRFVNERKVIIASEEQFGTVVRTCENGRDAEEFSMRDWRQVLQQWIVQESSIASLAKPRVEGIAWAIYPPSVDHWPSHLPTCQALQDFYCLCDGGNFNWFRWISLSQLGEQNQKWFQLLSDWDMRGDVLLAERHVVLAEDGGGCPVVWDTPTDQVRAFQFDGGDWEPPLASSVEAFLTDLFNPEGEKEKDWWYQFLRWLDSHQKE